MLFNRTNVYPETPTPIKWDFYKKSIQKAEYVESLRKQVKWNVVFNACRNEIKAYALFCFCSECMCVLVNIQVSGQCTRCKSFTSLPVLVLQFEALKVPYPKDTTSVAIDTEEKEAVCGLLSSTCMLTSLSEWSWQLQNLSFLLLHTACFVLTSPQIKKAQEQIKEAEARAAQFKVEVSKNSLFGNHTFNNRCVISTYISAASWFIAS